jgi:hypothetical protein
MALGVRPSWPWGWLNLSFRWYDRRYLREAGTSSKSLDPYGVADLGVGVQQTVLGLQANLSLWLENFTDTRYEVLERQPMPGRSYLLALKIAAGSDGRP